MRSILIWPHLCLIPLEPWSLKAWCPTFNSWKSLKRSYKKTILLSQSPKMCSLKRWPEATSKLDSNYKLVYSHILEATIIKVLDVDAETLTLPKSQAIQNIRSWSYIELILQSLPSKSIKSKQASEERSKKTSLSIRIYGWFFLHPMPAKYSSLMNDPASMISSNVQMPLLWGSQMFLNFISDPRLSMRPLSSPLYLEFMSYSWNSYQRVQCYLLCLFIILT